MISFVKKNRFSLIFLFFLTIVAYANAWNNAFLSDDLAEIVNNPHIGDLGYAITSHPFGFIRLILYWLIFHIGGLNQILFRSINYVFHVGSVFLVFAIVSKLYSKRAALFTSAIFAVHPAITEAVIWISGGMYPQYAFFILLAFLLYILSNKSKKMYVFSILSYWASFMTHPQMPLALFLIFPLYELCFGNLKANWKKSIPYLGLAIAYVLISLSVIPSRETTLQTTHYQEKGVDNLFLTVPIAISSYFELIFFPKILTLYHSELAFGKVNFAIRAIIVALFFLGTLVSFKKNKHIFFWCTFFLLGLAPTLTPFRFNWIVAERYLYLPIIGILILIGLGLDHLSQKVKFKSTIYALFVLILVGLSVRTILRNIDWYNEDNLWIATGQTSPSSPNTHNNLGDMYGRHGDKQRALQEFQKAIEIKPNYGDAYHNLANTYMELGQVDKALENYQNALKYNPALWQSYQNIASIYFQEKKYDLALDNLQKAIQLNPQSLNLRLNLGIVYLLMGNKEQAKAVFNLILSVDPQNQVALQGLSEASK